MDTIEGYQADDSASTRLAVWALDLVLCAGASAGRRLRGLSREQDQLPTVATKAAGRVEVVVAANLTDEGRAYHSSYFEMLGEQGWPGLPRLARCSISPGWCGWRCCAAAIAEPEGDKAWISPLATALQHAHIIYLIGSLFVGIAFQSFVYMWMAIEIGLDAYCKRLGVREGKSAWGKTAVAAPGKLAARGA